MLQAGSTLGPYVIESLLAEGGMGAVYRAKNRVTGQLRALKVVKPELASKRDFVDRFVREATIASQLRHPNLVETLEPGIDGNTIYLPMELLEGETLSVHVKKKKRLGPIEAAAILGPVADAVQLLHDRGVVHRDLKPMNVFVTRGKDGSVVPKVIDLGTARDVDDEEHTRTGMVVGSPFYMAPEQAEGRRDIDGRADQYALGVIAYQLITGARPYESDDTRSALAKLLRGEPYAPPSRYFPGLAADVEAVIVRALEREREARFVRTADFGASFVAAAHGRPLPQVAAPPRPVAPPAPARPPAPPSLPPPPVVETSTPLGTPGPFAPPSGPPSIAPVAPSPRRLPLAAIGAVLVLLVLGGVGIAWSTSGPDMTATPIAPRSATAPPSAAPPPPISVPTTPAVPPEPAVATAPPAPSEAPPAAATAPPPAPVSPVATAPPPAPPSDPEPASRAVREASADETSGDRRPARTEERSSDETPVRTTTRRRDGSGDDRMRAGGGGSAPCGAATGIPCLD